MNDAYIGKKVSVIIPTYNRARFLPNAVKSLIAQEYDNMEIIIVDDGSDDDTQDVVSALKTIYPNIIYFDNERSKGPSGARNSGILKASGDYLSFLDSDDVWVEGQLKSGMELFGEYPEIDVLFGNASIIDRNSGEQFHFFDNHKMLHTLSSVEITPGCKILHGNLFEALIQESFFLFGSAIIRREVLNGILLDEIIMYSEDRDFAIRLYKEARARFAFRKDPVVIQYIHDSNICNIADSGIRQQLLKRKMAESHIYLFDKYAKTYDLSIHEKRLLNKIMANKLSNVSYDCWINKDYGNYLSYMLRSFKYYLTLTQVINILKVLIYPLIHHRYHKLNHKSVEHTSIRGNQQ